MKGGREKIEFALGGEGVEHYTWGEGRGEPRSFSADLQKGDEKRGGGTGEMINRGETRNKKS